MLDQELNAMNKYAITRLTTREDEKEFLRFWSDFLGHDQSDVYAWLNARDNSRVIVILLTEIESNRCLGCLSIIPRRLYIDGVERKIGIAGIFLVDKKHRTLLPALRLAREARTLVDNGELDLVYGLPNDKASGVFIRAGFEKLGPFVRLSKILSYSQYLDLTKPFHLILSPFVAFFDILRLLIQPDAWRRSSEDLRFETIVDVDSRFDDLWEKTKHRYKIVGDRNKDYIRWRFGMYAGSDISIFAILNHQNTNVLGYVAYRNENGYIDIRDAIMPDAQTIRRIFMMNLLQKVRELKPKSIAVDFLENGELIDIFKSHGFVQSKTQRYVHLTCSEEFARENPMIRDHNNWLLFRGDMDP